jgi:hypothetical protein
MSLTEKIEIDRIEVVRKLEHSGSSSYSIERDGVFVSKTFHRWILNPDSGYNEPRAKGTRYLQHSMDTRS